MSIYRKRVITFIVIPAFLVTTCLSAETAGVGRARPHPESRYAPDPRSDPSREYGRSDYKSDVSREKIIDLEKLVNEQQDDSNPSFYVILRLNSSPVQYLLFMPGQEPKKYPSNDLWRLGEEAKKTWLKTDDGPPNLILMGDGTQKDFDAVRLTIELNAKENLTSGEDLSETSFLFIAPQFVREQSPYNNIYEGDDWPHISVREEDRDFVAEIREGSAVLRLIAQTKELLAELIAATLDFLKNNRPQVTLDTLSNLEKAKLEADLRIAIRKFKDERPVPFSFLEFQNSINEPARTKLSVLYSMKYLLS